VMQFDEAASRRIEATYTTDWDSLVWHSSDRERMRRVLAAWDEHLADPYLPRSLTRQLEEAGFTVTARNVLPVLNAGYDENTLSAGLIGLIAAFAPGRQGVSDADATAWADDLRTLDGDYFFSLNRYLFAAVKSGSTYSSPAAEVSSAAGAPAGEGGSASAEAAAARFSSLTASQISSR